MIKSKSHVERAVAWNRMTLKKRTKILNHLLDKLYEEVRVSSHFPSEPPTLETVIKDGDATTTVSVPVVHSLEVTHITYK